MRIISLLIFLSFSQFILGDDLLSSFGEKVFKDPNISSDKKISCSTCHKQELLFTDGYEFALARDFKQPRNTPSLLTLKAYTHFFWDSTVDNLSEAIKSPLLDGVELRSHERILKSQLKNKEVVKQIFKKYQYKSYTKLVVESIKAFLLREQTLKVKYWSAPEELTSSETNGERIFFNKGQCFKCHSGKYFTDSKLHHSSLFKRKTILNFDGEVFSLNTDYGNGRVKEGKERVYKFRTPSLINVELTPPYMHDGSFNTLSQVLDYYNRGGDDPNYPLSKINLTSLIQSKINAN